jgi:ABC-2 type transport system ATP-binding protein
MFGVSKRAFADRSRRLLEITRLSRFADRRAAALSGGMYKKLALSCALLHQPSALLLDEPTNGVDPVSRRELWELMHELIADGMTVLVSTPYMDEADRCHRVALMHEGEIIAEGAPSALAAGLEHDVFEVVAADIEALHTWLTSRPEIIAASPAGSRVRIVVATEHRAWLETSLASLRASLQRTRPSFEDVFLSRVGGRSAATGEKLAGQT